MEIVVGFLVIEGEFDDGNGDCDDDNGDDTFDLKMTNLFLKWNKEEENIIIIIIIVITILF